MTDVEAKTPTKRRILDKEDKKGSVKKAKLTPEKQKKAANKQNNVQNVNQKLKQKNKNIKSENGSPKKLKPFLGTSEMAASNEQEGKVNKKVTKANKAKSEQKKPRKNVFVTLKDKLNSKDRDIALKSLEDKIQAIQSRGELSKTAKKKLRLLNRLKRHAEGETVDQAEQQSTSNKPNTKKKVTEVTKVQQPNTAKKIVKNQTKMEVVKGNENKKAKLQNKQIAKKVQQGPKVQVVEAESSDEDDELDESDVEEEEDDEGDGASEEESGEEEEGDSDEDEEEDGEGEEDDDSNEDESEDDTPPQVSTKKQKKK